MTHPRRRLLQTALAVLATTAATLAGTRTATAQPTRPIRLIVPYPPGGPLDTVPEQFSAFVKAGLSKYGPVVKASGAQMD